MEIVDIVNRDWAWAGIEAEELVVRNGFGNLILKDAENRFWRLCPEDVYCRVVANSIEAYNALIQDEEFLEDWHMIAMLSQAQQSLGKLEGDEAFCLRVPGVLGGDYVGANVAKVQLDELVESAGVLGEHIEGQSDGAKIQLSELRYLPSLSEAS